MTITEQAPSRVEQAEANTRRLMAARAALPSTWEHRARRRELFAEINAALGEYGEACDG